MITYSGSLGLPISQLVKLATICYIWLQNTDRKQQLALAKWLAYRHKVNESPRAKALIPAYWERCKSGCMSPLPLTWKEPCLLLRRPTGSWWGLCERHVYLGKLLSLSPQGSLSIVSFLWLSQGKGYSLTQKVKRGLKWQLLHVAAQHTRKLPFFPALIYLLWENKAKAWKYSEKRFQWKIAIVTMASFTLGT